MAKLQRIIMNFVFLLVALFSVVASAESNKWNLNCVSELPGNTDTVTITGLFDDSSESTAGFMESVVIRATSEIKHDPNHPVRTFVFQRASRIKRFGPFVSSFQRGAEQCSAEIDPNLNWNFPPNGDPVELEFHIACHSADGALTFAGNPGGIAQNCSVSR